MRAADRPSTGPAPAWPETTVSGAAGDHAAVRTVRPSGVIVAPVTPMDGDLRVDVDRLAEVTEFLIAGGVHGLTPCAITAEAETLSLDEHRDVLATVLTVTNGRVPVYCGVGRPSILETRALCEFARDAGAGGLFLITPYATAHTLDEVAAYYTDIVGATDLPTIIYNCPGYSGVNLPPELVARLAALGNVVGIKEGNQDQLPDTLLLAGRDLAVLTARDSYLLPSVAIGAEGVVSFAANVAPELLVALYDAGVAGQRERALALHRVVVRLVRALVSRSYPVMIKEAMKLGGLDVGPARRVTGQLGEAERATLRAALDCVREMAETSWEPADGSGKAEMAMTVDEIAQADRLAGVRCVQNDGWRG